MSTAERSPQTVNLNNIPTGTIRIVEELTHGPEQA
jgi:hypothetical protein